MLDDVRYRLHKNLTKYLPQDRSLDGWVAVAQQMPMRAGFTLSGVFHLLAVLIFFGGFGGSFDSVPEIDISASVAVDVVNISEVANLPPRPGAQTTIARPDRPPPRRPTLKTPPPPTRPAVKPESTAPIAAVETTKIEPPEPQALPDDTADEIEPLEKEGVTQERLEPQRDFSSVLRTVEEFEEQEPQPAPSTPIDYDPDKPLAKSVVQAIKETVERCWAIPAGARNAEDLVVEIDVSLNQDGTVAFAEVVNTSRARRDPFYRTAAESALRAVYNPNCNPLPVPLDQYEKWRTMRLRFNPREMLGF